MTRFAITDRLIFVAGFMGTGKSTVGRRLADRLGRAFVDLDEQIESEAHATIPELFASEGEAGFRRREGELLERLCREGGARVVAVGGGAPCHGDNLEKMRAAGLVVVLTASPDEILARVGDAAARPLLARAADRRREVERLLAERAGFYAQAHLTVDTTGLPPSQVVSRILEEIAPEPRGTRTLEVRLPSATYPIHIDTDAGAEARLAEAVAQVARGPIGLVTDETVARLHGERVGAALEARGLTVVRVVVPDGEGSKSLARAEVVAEAFAAAGLTRRSLVVAFGGGVVGDLAGFVASVFLRGVPYVQVPTTLLAQVDSSVGGKTGVNLPSGKNLVGTFYQPLFVYADLSCLRTLAPRDMSSGLAEIVKHGAIADADLFALLESRAEDAAAGDPALLAELIERSCAIKARIVAADEHETAGDAEGGGRARLNFGHTIGHALETASAQAPRSSGDPLRHGEAVALGMIAAARLAARLGEGDAQLEARLVALLPRLGLPTDLDRRLDEATLARIGVDKKREGGVVRMVFVSALGASRLCPVEPARVAEILLAPAN